MTKKLLIPVLALILGGCSSGDTPVEVVKTTQTAPPKDSMSGAVQSNPNLPPAAKNALLGGKR
jgi:hypothetical protein